RKFVSSHPPTAPRDESLSPGTTSVSYVTLSQDVWDHEVTALSQTPVDGVGPGFVAPGTLTLLTSPWEGNWPSRRLLGLVVVPLLGMVGGTFGLAIAGGIG